MIIKSLTLKNYGIIKNANLSFKEKGFNLFAGSTGQGKSHTIRAINYLLFGQTYGKLEDDCNWEENSFTIQASLSHINNFNIKTFYSKKGGAVKELWVDDSYIKGNDDVRKTLAQYFDPSIAKASMLSLQGDMDIVNAGDSERREYLKKIYSLNFDAELKSLKEDKTAVEEKIIEVDKKIYMYENKNYDESPLRERPFTEEDYQNYLLQIKELQQEKEKIKLQEEILKDIVKSLDSIINRIHTIDSEQKMYSGKIEDVQRKQLVIEEKLKTIDSDFDKQKEDIKVQIVDIILKRVPPSKQAEIDSLQKEYQNILIQESEVTKHLSLVEKGLCPTCGKPFETTEVEEYQNRKLEIDKQKKEIVEKLSSLKQEEKSIQELKETQRSLKIKKTNLEEKLTSLDSSYKREKTLLLEQLEDAKKLDKTYVDIFTKNQEEYEKLVTEQDELELRKSKMTLDEFDEGKLQDLEMEVRNYEKIKSQNEMTIEENKKIKKQEDRDKKILKSLREDKSVLSKQVEDYKKMIEIVKVDFPKFVVNSMVTNIEDGMNSLLNLAYDGRYNCSILESKKGLQIVYGSSKKDIKLSSGGEQNLFNLGFKNALTQISGLKVLILDEADNFLSGDIAKKAFTSLNQLIENGDLNQVFMISHNEEVKDMIETDFRGKVFHFNKGEVY